MKTSHYKTPRTMAECEFVVGYPIIEQHKEPSNWVIAIAAAAFIVLMLWIGK